MFLSMMHIHYEGYNPIILDSLPVFGLRAFQLPSDSSLARLALQE